MLKFAIVQFWYRTEQCRPSPPCPQWDHSWARPQGRAKSLPPNSRCCWRRRPRPLDPRSRDLTSRFSPSFPRSGRRRIVQAAAVVRRLLWRPPGQLLPRPCLMQQAAPAWPPGQRGQRLSAPAVQQDIKMIDRKLQPELLMHIRVDSCLQRGFLRVHLYSRPAGYLQQPSRTLWMN